MGLIGHPSIQRIIASAQDHYAQGNVVQFVLTSRSGADEDLGVSGTATPNTRNISPEPFLNGISVDAVMKGNGAFKFSDLRMTVAKDAMTDSEALDQKGQFIVNGNTFDVITCTPNASSYDFVIRRKVP